jgi:hypothetical protein
MGRKEGGGNATKRQRVWQMCRLKPTRKGKKEEQEGWVK